MCALLYVCKVTVILFLLHVAWVMSVCVGVVKVFLVDVPIFLKVFVSKSASLFKEVICSSLIWVEKLFFNSECVFVSSTEFQNEFVLQTNK